MNFSWKRQFLFVLAFVLLASVPAFAQATVGSISGTVTDPTGAVVPGATVTLVNDATGVTREATTNESGLFVFDRVRVGTYTLRITMSGFKVHEQRNLEVSVGKVTAMGDVRLEVGSTGETITITETTTPLVQGESPQIVGAYDSRKVSDISWATFGLDATAYLTAGVVPGFGNINSNTGGFSGQFGGAGFAPAAAGQRSRSTQFSVDGHEVNDISIGGPSIFVDNQDIVGEYQVTVNQFDAAGGRLPGAQINVITKSGTNELHGSLFYFYDANSLRSRTSEESKSDLRKEEIAKDISHQFGFTAGGPIIKNKWFVFGGHHRQRNPAAFFSQGSLGDAIAVTPAGMATLTGAGMNAVTRDLYNIWGPFGSDRGRFGNPSCTVGQTALATFGPVPNVEICGVSRTIPQDFFSWEATIKMDVVLNKQTFVGKYYDESEPFSVSGGLSGFWVNIPFRGQSFSLNHTYQFSPRVLNDFRFSYGRFKVAFEGANTEPISNIRENLARINLPFPFIDLGLATNLPQDRLLHNFQWSDIVSIVRGRHTIKAGAEIRRNRTIITAFLPFINSQINFGDTTLFFNNTPGSVQFADGPAGYQPFETDQFYFIQDDIRLRPNLTINLGLRYEHTGQPANGIHEETLARESGLGAFWNPAVALENRIFPKVSTDNNNWGPRIGFAYTPRFWKTLFGEDKTVIRGGYSVSYEAAFYNILLNISTAAPRVFLFTVAGFPLPSSTPTGAVMAAQPQLATPFGTRDPREFSRTTVSPDFGSPTVQNWTIGIQREFGNNMVWEVRYVGTKSTGQFQSLNANPLFSRAGGLGFQDFPGSRFWAEGAVPCTAADDPPTFLTTAAVGRVFCDSGPVRMRANSARSIYHGLQSRFDARNLWNQLTFGANYQWGKSIDNVSEIFFLIEGQPAFSQNPFDYLDGERGQSNFNLTHTFAAHWIWDAPWHRDQQGAIGKILGGWQLNGQWFGYSGRPWTPVDFFVAFNRLCGRDQTFNLTFVGLVNTCRPALADPSAPVHTVGFFGDPGVRWWITDCFLGFCPTPFGVSRNLDHGDDVHFTNMSLFKNTRFGPEGRFNFQIRWSMINVFNHRNFGVPDSFIDDSLIAIQTFINPAATLEDADFGLPNRNNAAGRVNRLQLRFTW